MGFLDRLRSARSPLDNSTPAVAPVPAASGHWLQLPTLAPGDGPGKVVDIVGESNYQQNLERVCGGRTADGPRYPLVTAQLVREPTNPHDRNAVRVDVDGGPAGYIPRTHNQVLHRVLIECEQAGIPATCRARVKGGWVRPDSVGSFGIDIDIDPSFRRREPLDPFLPAGTGCKATARSVDQHQDLLRGLLGGAPTWTGLASLTGHDSRAVTVHIDGNKVGELSPKMADRYWPWVTETAQARFPATCTGEAAHGQKRIDLTLRLWNPG